MVVHFLKNPYQLWDLTILPIHLLPKGLSSEVKYQTLKKAWSFTSTNHTFSLRRVRT
jgi:hypothetical protein